jgi:hypothetical protein
VKRLLAGLALGLLILLWISRRLDLGAVATALAGASPPLLAASLACAFVALWLKGERWAVAIAASGGALPRRRLFASMLVGAAGNIALPARVGDVARAFVLRKHNAVPVARSLTASWSVQVLDFLAVAVLLWTLSPATALASRAALAAVFAAAAGILAALALVRRFPGVLRFVDRLPARASRRLSPLLASAHDGLAFLDSPQALARVVAATLAIWVAEGAATTLGLRAFDLAPPLAAGPFLAAAIGLSFVLPLTPGSLGTYQLVTILVLGAYGIGREPAFAFGLAFQAVVQLTILLCGFAALEREGLDWRALPGERESPGPV